LGGETARILQSQEEDQKKGAQKKKSERRKAVASQFPPNKPNEKW